MSTPITFNTAYIATNSFTPSAPIQRQFTLNNTNPQYIRYTTMTQDALYFNVNGVGQVIIPLIGTGSLWAAASTANPSMTWPPVILTQPTSSTVAHPTNAYFVVCASAETNISYHWASSSNSGVNWTILPSGGSGNLFTGSLTNQLTHSLTTQNDSGSYVCYCTNTSGNVTSSIATLTIS